MIKMGNCSKLPHFYFNDVTNLFFHVNEVLKLISETGLRSKGERESEMGARNLFFL